VDARIAGTAGWTSLCRAQGPVAVGALPVGEFDGELDVQTLPTQLDGQKVGTYWLPMYYTQWTGRSLLGVDDLAQQLAGIPQRDGRPSVRGVLPTLALRYGETYEFRVRLADHTNGGPSTDDGPRPDTPHPVGTVAFRRYVRPGAPRIAQQVPTVA